MINTEIIQQGVQVLKYGIIAPWDLENWLNMKSVPLYEQKRLQVLIMEQYEKEHPSS